MTLRSCIRKSCVCTCWKKWRPFYIFFSHSPTIIDEKYFHWKLTHFRKIYQGHLSFFWSWWHFFDTGRLTKILEGTLVVNWLKWYLEHYNLLHVTQSGFRKRATDHIMQLHDIVGKSLANKHHVLVVFIDIAKAYDMVCTDALLFKLLKMGINGWMFNFIRSFLTNCSFQVRVGSKLSMVKYPTNGILQESILSLILFSIVINDLLDGICSPVALYADDFSFWESGSSIKQLNDLCQQSLAKVAEWCDRWGFKISQLKSTAVLFTNKCKYQEISLKMHDEIIPIKTEHRSLGITFQSNGTYNSHIHQIHSKCLKRLNVLQLLTGITWGAAKQPLLNIYGALVRSVLEYGMEVFFLSKSSQDQLNKIQYEALWLCMGAMRSTPMICLLQASGEIPLHVKHKMLCLEYKAHLLTFNNHPALSLIADSWHELYLDTPKFQKFNMVTKDTVSPDTFNIDPINISNSPPWILHKTIIDRSLTHILYSQNPEIIKRTALYHLQENYPDFVHV